MSVSVELAVFLDVLCRLIEPDRILDLGSGFSSFVLRRHLASRDVGVHSVIWSIDDSPEWLEQTRGLSPTPRSLDGKPPDVGRPVSPPT
jgi:hypothetical protein